MLGVKVAFSAGLLWLLFSRIDGGAFWAAARQSSLPWLVLALASYAVTVLVSSWRWHRLLTIQDARMSFKSVTASFLVSLFFNNFLPTNIGGDVMRVRDTARPVGSTTRAMMVVVADRIAGLIGLFLFAAVGGALMAQEQLPFSAIWIWVALLGGLGASAAVLFTPPLLTALLAPFGGRKSGWLAGQIETLGSSLTSFRAAPGGLLAVFAASVLLQGTFILFYAAVAKALGVHVPFFQLAAIVPLAGLIQLLPISVNGFGIREATFTVLFGRVGVSPESALLISLEATALILVFSVSGAVAYLLRGSASEPDSKKAAAEACTPR